MKKHFIFALIAAIIMSNCFSTVISAQEVVSSSSGKEILAEVSEEETEEALAPVAEAEEETSGTGSEEEETLDAEIEEAEAPEAKSEAEAPDAIIEEAAAAEADTAEAEAPDAIIEEMEAPDAAIEEAETPNADPEPIPEPYEPADSEELLGLPNDACGEKATWSIKGDRLRISGEGAMYDYKAASAPWYSSSSEIRTIFIEDGITQIGGYAFASLPNLVGVSMPSSLKKIGNGAFYNCTSLPAIEIPSGVTYIDTAALGKCTSLANVSFLGKAPSIQHMAFTNVTASVYYLSSGAGWTGNNKLQYGGKLTWKPVSEYYDVWLYGVRVNSVNADDIMCDRGAMYTPYLETLEIIEIQSPKGLAISRDDYEYSASVYAIGDLEIKGDFNLSEGADNDIYVDGKLTIHDSDTRTDRILANNCLLKDAQLNIDTIFSRYNIEFESCEIDAYGVYAVNKITFKNCSVSMTRESQSDAINSKTCDIQESKMTVKRSGGTAIRCEERFIISDSTLNALGKDAGINSPWITIKKGNIIVAKGAKGAIFGTKSEVSKIMDVARGYVFVTPKSPTIGPYGIMENGKNATFVSIRPLENTDNVTFYRGNTPVSKITLPTLSTVQLEVKTKDGYFVSGAWVQKNYGIVSIDKTGLVKAKKYGKTKIVYDVGSNELTCDVQTRFYDVNDPKQPGYKQIYWGVDKGIISGFDGGVYFGPNLPCTRLQFAVMMWRAKGKPKASGTLKFKDTKNLNPNTDSYKAILWASNNGIVKGYSDNTFRPNNNITRESIVIILWRMAGQPKAKKALPFKDTKKLSTTSTAYKAIAWASETKIVN